MVLINHDEPSNRFPVLSPREIEGMIAAGKCIIIMGQNVLQVDTWIPYHPGGHKTIQHLVGKDATDEIFASVYVYHTRYILKANPRLTLTHRMHSLATCEQMSRYKVGRIEGRWLNFTPPIQGGHFRPLIKGSKKQDNYQTRSNTGAMLGSRVPEVYASRFESEQVPFTTSGEPGGPGFLDRQTHAELALLSRKYPAIDENTQRNIIHQYRRLHAQIHAEGLYNCNYTAYAWEVMRYLLLFGLMLFLLRKGWYATSAVFMGLFWSQLVFAGHDAGHMGITHNYTIDTLIAMTIAAPIGGLSMGWWKRTHNVHHIVTNAPEHDPDNQHLPFLAVNHRFLGSIFSTYHERWMPYNAVAKFIVPYQAYLFYPVLMFGRFNLYIQSLIFLALGQGPRKGAAWWHRWFEITGIAFFWFWFGYGVVYRSIPTAWNRVLFIMVSHMVNMPLHLQFTLSHFAMSTAELGPGESFPQKMLRTTMDIECPEWLDWFHGGLQFQAIHHLYPRIPRHNLRRTQNLVQKFCDDVNIPYALYGFSQGNVKVLGSLAEVSRQATILAQCQQAIVQRGNWLDM